MNILFGLLTGVATGILQMLLLAKFTRGVTSASADAGKARAYFVAGMVQLLLPFAVLIAVALLYTDALLWTGIGAGTSLILLGVIRTLLGKKEG